MKRVIVLYIPVLHEGYLEFFKKHNDADILYILGEDFIDEFSGIHKEIRALSPETIKKLVESLSLFKSVKVLGKKSLSEIGDSEIVTADEAISLNFVNKYFPKNRVFYDNIFLRWDEKNVYSENLPQEAEVSDSDFDRKIMELAKKQAEKSSDWWRQVGAVIVKDGKVILEDVSHHLPSDHISYIEGNPRDFIEAGTKRDLSTSIHVEQLLVGEAARRGLSLEGTSIYINVFPCVPCAQIISQSGIKKCYFQTGNAYLNVERVFRMAGVKLILVK
ncbi:MAG: hypothetical protein HYW37_00210 [Candidatus Colwellbacteria bacterium]|nr:hypothetical protein [Candidatus Colwellbacteria bacterium]